MMTASHAALSALPLAQRSLPILLNAAMADLDLTVAMADLDLTVAMAAVVATVATVETGEVGSLEIVLGNDLTEPLVSKLYSIE